jgi:YbbR domain-containing protein
MKHWLLHNLGWKLLSVVIAFLLWVAVASEPELATSVPAAILFKDLPDDLDISSNVPARVQLELRGPSRRLTPQLLEQVHVVLDLTDVQPGERTFTIHDWNIHGLPFGVEFYRTVPSQISLAFERLSAKDVPIEPIYSKQPPDGYRVVQYSFEPPQIRIRGPEGRVQRVDHVTTDPIDLSGVVSKTELRLHVRVGDPQIRLETPAVVKFKVQLQNDNAKDVK